MALNLEQGGLSYHPFALHGGLDAPALVPQQAARPPAAAAAKQRPPLPVPPMAAQHRPPTANSCLTHSLQAGRHAAAAAGAAGSASQPMTACAPQAAPLPAPPLAPSMGFPFPPQQATLPPAALYASSWHAAVYAQQQQQQAAAYSMAAGMVAGGAAGAACHASMLAQGGHTGPVAAGWPTLQPHAGPYGLFPGQAAQAQAALSLLPQQQAGAVACGGAAVRRRTRRRPIARRSLLDLFDAAAASEEASVYDSMDDSDSECDIMQLCSQESAASSMMPFPSSHPAARTPAPRTPFSQEQSSSITPPAAQGSSREGGRSSSPSPADTPSTPQAGAAEDHMLSLQHLLMSERARTLSALEVKAIVFKVAADLASLHDAGVLHRHVTIASVALSRTGNLATARLMGHPYNVDAGQTRRYTGGKKAGVDAYLAPELARCPADCVAYTPAADMWSLGVVLFVLLSGSHVPFGNRGLCWTTVPNMPGLKESVDKLQKWLEEHLACKVQVINQLKANQEKGKAPLGEGPKMRVVGVDDCAGDLLMRLLAADPAARPSACQVLSHPWLAEVEGLVSGASKAPAAPPAARLQQGRPPPPEELAAAGMSPGFEAQLRRTASDLAHLGFSPATPSEDVAPPLPPLHRGASDLSATSTDCHFEFGSAGPSCDNSAHASCADLTEAFAAAAPGISVHSGRAAAAPQQAQQAAAEPRPAAGAESGPGASFAFVLQDGTALQLLSHEAAAALVASGALPDLSAGSGCGAALPFPPLGFAVHPTGATVEGQSSPLAAIYVVYNVEGQAMLAAEPIAVTQLPGPAAARPSAAAHKPAPAAAPPAGSQAAPAQPPPPPPVNPDLGTSAPILPLLARMLQQQQQQ